MEGTKKTIKIHKPDVDEKVFFFGMGVTISVPLTLFVYQYTDLLLVGLDPFLVSFFSRVIFAPFVEEFSKAYPLFYRHGETERTIVDLSLIVGLGFGIVEFEWDKNFGLVSYSNTHGEKWVLFSKEQKLPESKEIVK